MYEVVKQFHEEDGTLTGGEFRCYTRGSQARTEFEKLKRSDLPAGTEVSLLTPGGAIIERFYVPSSGL